MSLEFVGGCMGGAAGVLVGYPFDTAKVRIQTSEAGTYRGTFHCLFVCMRKKGVEGLYKGITSPLLGVAGINAITFGVYAQVLKQLPQADSISSITIAGASAGLIQTSIVSPMELVKTQMQVRGLEDISGAVSHITRSAGFGGLFRGLGITLTREVPAFAVYFGSYEVIVRNLGESTAAVLFGGGTAGVLSWLATYPQDVIKTRLQADSFGASRMYKGPLHCLELGLKEEGSRFLFRGIGTTVIRAFPTNAATFFVFTFVKKIFGNRTDVMDPDTIEDLQKKLNNRAQPMSL